MANFLFVFSLFYSTHLIFGELSKIDKSGIERSTSTSPMTKFDERNVEELRDLCRNFSQGDMINGEFATPNYPRNYPASLECVKVIHVPIDYTILIDFRGTFFEIEKSEGSHQKWKIAQIGNKAVQIYDSSTPCPYDYLEVRNGPYGFSPLIGRYCGYRFPPVIAADSGSMWLLFKSDHTIQYRGFRAVHYATPKIALPDPTKYRSHICSFSHTPTGVTYFGTDDIQGVYADLFANRSQNSPIECVWKVQTGLKMQRLRLHFETFDLLYPNECSLNSMEIYAYTTSRSHVVKQLCGRIAMHIDTRASVAYVRIFLSENSFIKTIIKASFIPYARGKDCNGSMFSCGDDTCIPRSLVCNGRSDCLSDLDERRCGKADRPLFNFFNSPYLVIFIIIVTLIAVIIFCAIFVNVWHGVKKRRIIYAPARRSNGNVQVKKSPTNGRTSPIYQHGASPVPEPRKLPDCVRAHATRVPTPKNLRTDQLFGRLPLTDDTLHLCGQGRYVNMDELRGYPIPKVNSPKPDLPKSPRPKLDAPKVQRVQRFKVCPDFSAHPLNAHLERNSKLSRSPNQIHESPRRSKPKQFRPTNGKKVPKIQSRSQSKPKAVKSQSKNEFHSPTSHKFWTRVEDLITTTEESDAAPDTNRPIDDHAADLSDLAINRQSSSDDSSEEGHQDNGEYKEEWKSNEPDSTLETELLRLESTLP